MIKNYLLLALKVLRRKPFYTFISLFGISFTLMILMLLTALFDASLGSNPPLSKRDRMTMIMFAERKLVKSDTVQVIDTIRLDGGKVRYDTSEQVGEKQTMSANGPMSYDFIHGELGGLPTVKRIGIFGRGRPIDGYVDGQKFVFAAYRTDADYWDVLDFRFLHGSPFLEEDIASASRKVILTDHAAREYFGTAGAGLLGREVAFGPNTYTVSGIVARPATDDYAIAGDVFMPLELPSEGTRSVGGGFSAVIEVDRPDQLSQLEDELTYLTENYRFPAGEQFNRLTLKTATIDQAYAMIALQESDPERAYRLLFIPLLILTGLFVALPLINLINLNVSRIFERRQEIGVRKAFGAAAGDIVYQFVLENLVVTVIGGMIGLVLALLSIHYLNTTEALGMVRLQAAPRILIYYLLLVLVFSLLSGLVPAYRMSRADVADSLQR